MDELDFHRALFRPGTLIDAGAHDGGLTLPFAALPGAKVIAFEPLPQAFGRLQNLVLAQYGGSVPSHISLQQTALGDQAGEIVLEVPVVGGVMQEQWASVAKDYEGLRAADPRIETIHRVTVAIQPLDALALADVTGIKIDVEGAEAEVLRGARETLLRCQPVLSVEIEERHRPGNLRRVPYFLSELGYQGFYEYLGEWRKIEQFDPLAMQRASPSPADFKVSDPYIFCFYFVPRDRVGELAQLARLPKT